MTGFGARRPAIVQSGGVAMPPHWRSQGLARVALALHPMRARGKGDRPSRVDAPARRLHPVRARGKGDRPSRVDAPARRLHPVRARGKGVTGTPLFAAGDRAGRAGPAIGMRRSGSFGLVPWHDPRQVPHG